MMNQTAARRAAVLLAKIDKKGILTAALKTYVREVFRTNGHKPRNFACGLVSAQAKLRGLSYGSKAVLQD